MKRLGVRVGAFYLLAGLLVVSCSSDNAPPVPFPALGDFEPAVREHLENARSSLESALVDGGGDPQKAGDAYGECGMVHHAYMMLDTALACYQQAAELQPQEPRWFYLLGKVLRIRQRFEESEQNYLATLELQPGHLPAQIALGNLLYELDSLEEAGSYFDIVLGSNPYCVPALAGLGRIALARGDAQQAIELLEHALDLSPASSAF